MKKYLLLACLFNLASPLLAQDLIVTTKGDSLNCKITKIKPDFIYFTFVHKEEVRQTLLPIHQIIAHRYNYYQTTPVSETASKNTPHYQQFSIGLRGGYSYRTAPVSDQIPQDFRNYIRDLKSGLTYGVDGVYYFSETLGAGINYSAYHSSNSISNIYMTRPDGSTNYGRMSDDITISFIGPSFNVRILNANKQNELLTSGGFGYLGYKNNAVLIDKFTIAGNTVGFTWGIGWALATSKNTALGFQLNFMGGLLTQYKITEGATTRTVNLEKESYEGLSRVDLTIGLKFNK